MHVYTGDVIVLKHILHDWPDKQAMDILTNIKYAITHSNIKKVTVVLIEFVLEKYEVTYQKHFFDILMKIG